MGQSLLDGVERSIAQHRAEAQARGEAIATEWAAVTEPWGGIAW